MSSRFNDIRSFFMSATYNIITIALNTSHKLLYCFYVRIVSKAFHIKLASNITTKTFISILKRFITRAGNPSVIYSNNRTISVGRKTHLTFLFQHIFYKTQNHLNITQQLLSSNNVSWKFIYLEVKYHCCVR